MRAWPVADFVIVMAAILASIIWAVVHAVGAEVHGPVTRWWTDRLGLTDRAQSECVRRLAVQLAHPIRKVRRNAVSMLADLNDRSAVPALIRSAETYKNDGLFLEDVVRCLHKLGDARAIPLLRQLSHGRHQWLMAAARRAIDEIEPANVLLRPAEQSNALLRPAGSAHRPAELLRPANGPNVQDISGHTGNR